MAEYKRDLQFFRQRTTLKLFCLAQPDVTGDDPPPGFKKMVGKYDWPDTVTLEHIEKFSNAIHVNTTF